MSQDFSIKRDVKKTVEITQDDIDEIKNINLESLDGQSLNSSGSLHFTKEKFNDHVSNVSSNKSNPFPFFKNTNKKQTKEKSPNVNIKKGPKNTLNLNETSNKKKPINEPNSIDLGLEHLANPNKKVIKEDDSISESENKTESSLGEFENVRDIMKDDNNSSSNHSKEKDNVSELSNLIKEKISKKSNLTTNQRKQELLHLFNKLESKGFKLNQKFSMNSPLEDMEQVYQRLENERNLKNSIKFQRRVLMGIVSTLEFVNTTFNPFDVDLEGWSESVMENYSEYDDIFEELYEKYKDKGKISPEVKLLMTLAGSAFYFHLSKTIIRSGQQKINELFGSSGNQGGSNNALGGLMSGFMNNFMNAGDTNGIPNTSNGMKGPQGFDDILSNKSGSQNQDLDDIPSIHSSNSSNGKKKKKTLKF